MFGYSPLWLFVVASQIFFAVHAARTGRSMWLFIIIFVPGLGSLIYFIAEYLPEMRNNRSARRLAGRVASSVANTLDPGKRLRELEARYKLTPSFANRGALANAYLEENRLDEAIALFEENSAGVHAKDPSTMRGLALAWHRKGDYQKARECLVAWRQRKESSLAGEMDMLYAEVLEKTGDDQAAAEEYRQLARRIGGEEARVRAGLVYRRLGMADKAREQFEEALRNAEVMGSDYAKANRKWIELAERELK